MSIVNYSKTQYLFNRQWSVQLIPGVQTTTNQYGTPIFVPSSQSQLFQMDQNGNNLKVVFDFKKTAEGSSNKGKLEVWNLNATSRKSYQKGAGLILKAGYSGLLKTILIGEVLSNGVTIERRNQDIVTTFEFGSSEFNIQLAIITKSYPPGTDLAQIVNDCANALGVSQSTIIGIPNKTFNNSVTLCDPVNKVLDDLTKPYGLIWSVQDDELIIYPKGQSLPMNAIFLSTGRNALGENTTPTGLIGVPSRADGGITRFSTLLNPDIYPGVPVQIESENVNGYFIIQLANFKGDSHGKEWQIDCEAVDLQSFQTATNQAGSL